MAVICDTATVGLIYRIGTLGSRDRGGHARRHPSPMEETRRYGQVPFARKPVSLIP